MSIYKSFTETTESATSSVVKTGDNTKIMLPGILTIVTGIVAVGTEVLFELKDKKNENK